MAKGRLGVDVVIIEDPSTIRRKGRNTCARLRSMLRVAEPSSELVAKAYGEKPMRFGPDYLIPKPFDPRLIIELAPAVAKAAMDSKAQQLRWQNNENGRGQS